MPSVFDSDSPVNILRAPASFGRHPNCGASSEDYWKNLKRGDCYKGHIVSVNSLPVAGKVCLIPRDRYLEVVDEFGDEVAVDYPGALNGAGLDKAVLPFSSTDFYADIYEEPYFKEMLHAAFFRLGGINQLGYLVPPRPEEWKKDIRVSYTFPQFKHTRWAHSRLVAFLMEAVLAKNGFSEKERFLAVLTAAYHDVATPSGGDSAKRVDPVALNEEENFDFALNLHGLAQKWKEEYGFDVASAKQWVKGRGLVGQVLDIVDKMAYTALDCLYLGLSQPCKVRSYGIKHPLVMDVWEDLQVNSDRTSFAFTDANRLFRFLLFRAYEHLDLLMNPYSRALDFFLTKMIKPLYRRGVVTKEELLTQNDEWLQDTLRENYPGRNVGTIIEPERLSWKKFDRREDFQRFCAGHKADHTERIKGFNTGLNFGVYDGAKIIPLKSALSKNEAEEIEGVNRKVKGYYIYYAKGQ